MKRFPPRRLVDLALRAVAATILFQTLFFKFSGSAESVYIFSTLRMEPWGRIGSGVAELVACALLVLPGTVALGALLSAGVIAGAVASHLTLLGIEVLGDGGLLFTLALVVLLASLGLLWLRRHEIPFLGERFGQRAGTRVPATPEACALGASLPAASGRRRVLVLGGGFGGVYTALALERALAWTEDVDVTLVNRENFFLFTPMLHEVAASDLDATDIVSPIRKLLRRTAFFEGEAVSVDLEARTVVLRHGSSPHEHRAGYDVLVLALGCTTNFFDLPGLAERALTMKSLGDALRLRNRMIASLEEADTECASEERRSLCALVVAGGGFSGVETVASVNDFLRSALRLYPRLSAADVRPVLVHPGPVVLPELGPELGRYTQRKLAERGVDVRVGTRVEGFDGERVRLSDGTELPSRTLVWTAGTSPHPLLGAVDAPKERGRLRVDLHLRVEGRSDVFALGDCAAVPAPGSQGFCPPTAQHALRQARVVARNVLAVLEGREPRHRFGFRGLGQLAAIGHRTGVARVLGVRFSGFAAWWLWRTVYLSKLPRFEKKLRVALDWTLDLLFSKDPVRYLDRPADARVAPGEEPTFELTARPRAPRAEDAALEAAGR